MVLSKYTVESRQHGGSIVPRTHFPNGPNALIIITKIFWWKFVRDANVHRWPVVVHEWAKFGPPSSHLYSFEIRVLSVSNSMAWQHQVTSHTRAPSQYPERRLFVRSPKVSKPLLPKCLSNFKAIRQFKVPISWLRDFRRSYGKTSFRIMRRGPDLEASLSCGSVPKWPQLLI